MEWQTLLQRYNNGNPGNQNAFFANLLSPESLGPTIVAMANKEGGNIFIGVDFKNYHLVGAKITPEEITQMLKQQCHPKVNLVFESLDRNNKSILCISVPNGPDKPYTFNRKCYVRDNSQTRQATIEEEGCILDAYPAHKIYPEPAKPQSEASQDSTLENGQTSIDSWANPTTTTTDTETVFNSQQSKLAKPETNEPSEALIETDVNDAPVTSILEEIQLGKSAIAAQSTPNPLPEVTPDTSPPPPVTNTPQPTPTKKKPPIYKTLSKRQRRALNYLKNHNFIKNKEFRTLYHVSHKTAHLELVDMVQKGLIRSEGMGRSTCYVLLSEAEQDAAQATPNIPAPITQQIEPQIEAPTLETKTLPKANTHTDTDFNEEEFEESLYEIQTLIDEVKDAGNDTIQDLPKQDHTLERHNFLLTYLKNNDMISVQQYCRLLQITPDVAESDLNALVNTGELTQLVNEGKLYYMLTARNETDDITIKNADILSFKTNTEALSL